MSHSTASPVRKQHPPPCQHSEENTLHCEVQPQSQGPPTPIAGEGSIHRNFPGITFPDNFNAICTLEPGSLKQLDPGWELQSISVFTSMFQRYQSSTPSTLHTGLAQGSHVELLSPGAQQLSEKQPVEERDGNQELRQSHPTEAWISICLSHTEGKKKHHQKVRHQVHPAVLWM